MPGRGMLAGPNVCAREKIWIQQDLADPLCHRHAEKLTPDVSDWDTVPRRWVGDRFVPWLIGFLYVPLVIFHHSLY